MYSIKTNLEQIDTVRYKGPTLGEKNCETGLASAIHRNMTLTSEISSQMHNSNPVFSDKERN